MMTATWRRSNGYGPGTGQQHRGDQDVGVDDAGSGDTDDDATVRHRWVRRSRTASG
ncbi:hypothetical protein [Nonlabens ponticola]|uniref:hypothetical protein n=1 Tax=Nonlabens ponticola TaxID=2496866 RepID=UPI0013DF9F7B|nr:hypothetical protein [Nonlabens ponticola]